MNVKEYISSGIIESYVMGLASDEERREFEANCAQYPEIAEARNAFETTLEEQLTKDTVPVPAFLKQQINEKIKTASFETTTEPEEENTPVRRTGMWRWVAAASLILLAASLYWAITTNRKYESLRSQNRELRDSVSRITGEIAALKGGSRPRSDFKMASINEGSQAAASIYWDTVSKDVYLMIKNMPQPPSDKQYQLWALLPEEGAPPINLGMIELRQERLLYRMKNVQNARAFAITLEPRGGSPEPTGHPMVSTQPVNL